MSKIERIIVYGLLATLFVLAAIFDLQIAQSVYQPTNFLGRIGEAGAEVPMFFLGTFCALLIAFFHPRPNKGVHYTLLILFLLIAAGLSVYAGHHTEKLIARAFELNYSKAIKYVIMFAIAAFHFGGSFALTRLVKKENGPNAFFFAIYFVALIGIALLLMQGLKMIWLRPRYRTLVALKEVGAIGDIAAFWKPVYSPQFFTSFARYTPGGEYGFTLEQIDKAVALLHAPKWAKEEFYSFPSGHTLNTIILLSLACLGDIFPKIKEKKHFGLIMHCCVYALAALVALSRMLRGAHYASDVTFGFFLGVLTFDFGTTFLYHRFLLPRFLKKEEAAAE